MSSEISLKDVGNVTIPDWFVAEEWPEINGGGVVDIHQIRELEKRWNEFKRTTEGNR